MNEDIKIKKAPTKPSTVIMPLDTMDKLRAISQTRKSNQNLAWSQQNIVIELINGLYRKECKS